MPRDYPALSGIYKGLKMQQQELIESSATETPSMIDAALNAVNAEKPISGGYHATEYATKRGNFIVTGIQNNTNIHSEFWLLLKQYAKARDAEIITCPILYNKNAFAQPADVEHGVWFWPEAAEHMESGRIMLNDNVLLVGDAHVLPTAVKPLSGFNALGNSGEWVIVPAATIQLECTAALKGEEGKALLSTGTATLKNYVGRKAGMTAELRHNFAFVIVEEGKKPRSVEYKNGGFYDFDGDDIVYYGEAEFPQWDNVTLTLGDIHAEKCPMERILALQRIIAAVKPEHVCLHDLHDFTSRNHHNRENQFFRYEADMSGKTVKGDIAEARKLIKELAGAADDATFHVIQSNHDLALDRWINENDWRFDTLNAEIYLKLALAKLRSLKSGETFNALAHAIGSFRGIKVNFLSTDESLMLNGVEHGHHGDKGTNGAKGSLIGFSKLGTPVVVGHSHSPGILGGAYQVGVSGSLEMGYNTGPSSWRHAHCLTFPNGQRQMVFE